MKYRILLVLTVLCIMFSMASCKKKQDTGNNSNTNNTNSGSVATTLDGEPAAEGTTEFKPLEVQENATIELPEDGTFTGH